MSGLQKAGSMAEKLVAGKASYCHLPALTSIKTRHFLQGDSVIGDCK